MTTIAFKDGILAADSQGTLGGSIIHNGPVKKIYTPEEGDYWEVQGVRAIAFGFCGDYGQLPFVIDLLREGLTHKTKAPEGHELDIAAIIVLETGDTYVFSAFIHRGQQRLNLMPLNGNVSIGSGETFALAAMSIGKSAVEAIEVAMKIDTGTSGEIHTFVVPPRPEVLSKRPVKPSEKTYSVDEVKDLLKQQQEQHNTVASPTTEPQHTEPTPTEHSVH